MYILSCKNTISEPTGQFTTCRGVACRVAAVDPESTRSSWGGLRSNTYSTKQSSDGNERRRGARVRADLPKALDLDDYFIKTVLKFRTGLYGAKLKYTFFCEALT